MIPDLSWLTTLLWTTTDWSWLKVLQLTGWILVFLDLIGFALVVIVLFPRLKPIFSKATWITRPVCRRLQLPIGKELSDFKNSLLDRSYWGSALVHVERIIDRQINKARGILPFNSIIMTINSFGLLNSREIKTAYTVNIINQTERWIFVTAAISSLLLLELFWSHWGKSNVYETIENDVVEGVIIVRNRAIILDAAIVLSLACVLCVSIAIFVVDYQRAIEASAASMTTQSPESQINGITKGLQTSMEKLRDIIDNLNPVATALLIELKKFETPVSPKPKPATKHANPSRH